VSPCTDLIMSLKDMAASDMIYSMRILLIQPPSPKIYQAFLPLGLAYIAGSLMGKGHNVTIWELNAERPSRRVVQRRIKAEGAAFELVGITGLTGDYPYLEWLSTTFKSIHPKTKIVAGGHLASALPAVLMENLPIDFAVVGEGEEASPAGQTFLRCMGSTSGVPRARSRRPRQGRGSRNLTSCHSPLGKLSLWTSISGIDTEVSVNNSMGMRKAA
jgi:hypothetical protein